MATLITNRDFAHLVFIFVVADRLNWFLWATALGTFLFAVILWLAALSERKVRLSLIIHQGSGLSG